MAKQIARLLKADIQETSDLKSIAKMLSKKGRGGDTMLAHITPKEARILKEAGGSGTINPDTGLMEFYDEYGYTPDFSETQQNILNTVAPQQQYMDTSGFEGISQDAAAPAPAYDLSQPIAGQVGQYQPVDYSLGTGATTGLNVPSEVAPAAQYGLTTDYSVAPRTAPAGLTYQGVSAAPTTTEVAPTPSALQKYVTDPLKQLKDVTGLTGADLLRVGGAGAGAIAGRAQAQKAAQQIQQAVQEQKQVGQPYQKAGQELQRAALAGELTPQSAQAYQALQAQMRQGIEARGGVGVAQAQAQMEAFRQNLLQNQYNFGLQVSQIGDQMALGAIRTGMQLDQQLAQANQAFYTQLAAIAGGGTYGTQQQTTGRP